MARDISLLHPTLQKKAKELISLCKKNGTEIIITQTLRSKAEQTALYAQGRTKPGAIVTNAKYPQSLHCWGVAFDIAVMLNGKVTWDTKYYDKVGKLAKQAGLGLVWGGDWKNFPDRPHFELPGYKWSELQKKYGTPEKFMATWKKGEENVEKTKVLYKGKQYDGFIDDGKTYVEVRQLAQAFGKKVNWNATKKIVEIVD